MFFRLSRPLVDEVLALEEGAEVEDLPDAEQDDADSDGDGEPLDARVGRLWSGC
jgi:hypothetical protein